MIYEGADTLVMWTIYDHPTDYPTCFVARKWLVRLNVQRTDTLMMADDIEMLRAPLAARGLTQLWRAQEDEPQIVETWF